MDNNEKTFKDDSETGQLNVKSQHGDREVLVQVGEEKLFIRLFAVVLNKDQEAKMVLHVNNRGNIYEADLRVPEKLMLL